MKEIANSETTLIVDVRSPEEYSEGHIEGSTNIPLETVTDSIALYKKYENVILVCRSGNRSGQAIELLSKFELPPMHNGGAWDSLNKVIDSKQ